LHDGFKKGLEERQLSVLEFCQLLEVVLAAKYLVPEFRKASRGGESYITCAND
jgi:hypothetical protein